MENRDFEVLNLIQIALIFTFLCALGVLRFKCFHFLAR